MADTSVRRRFNASGKIPTYWNGDFRREPTSSKLAHGPTVDQSSLLLAGHSSLLRNRPDLNKEDDQIGRSGRDAVFGSITGIMLHSRG